MLEGAQVEQTRREPPGERRMPSSCTSREEYLRHLEQFSSHSISGQDAGPAMIKSYVLETQGNHSGDRPSGEALMESFAQTCGLRVDHLDGQGMSSLADSFGVVAVVDQTATRFPVLHSTVASTVIDGIIPPGVARHTQIDHIWLSNEFFEALWEWTLVTVESHKVASIHLSHKGSAYPSLLEEDDRNDDEGFLDQQVAQITVKDRVREIDRKLSGIREMWGQMPPITKLGIPSSEHGMHEVYHSGKITNRSHSFDDQRQIINLVTNYYTKITDGIEASLWCHAEPTEGGGCSLSGAPAFIRFRSKLNPGQLGNWVRGALSGRDRRFRLIGNTEWENKDGSHYHISGIDQHMWQPFLMEATPDYLKLVLPHGTCSNIVSRLSALSEQHLSSTVEAWAGDIPYKQLLAP